MVRDKDLKRRVVAIAGKAQTTARIINTEPDSVEIWGLSDSYLHLKRPADMWFEIHTPDSDGLYRGFGAWNEGGPEAHLGWLWDCGIPVYMNKVDPRVPTGIEFPFSEIGLRYRPYWTSTVAYMLSLAAYEQVDEIHLWGVEMCGGTEYEHQRPCVEYWLGVLETQGCRVYIPSCAPLLKPMGGTYGVIKRKYADTAAIQDELSQWDLKITQGDNGARNGREALIKLMNRLDPATRGKIIEPQVSVFGDDDEAIEKRTQQVREIVLGNLGKGND